MTAAKTKQRRRRQPGRPKTIKGEPWKQQGISRSQWFRRRAKRKAKQDAEA